MWAETFFLRQILQREIIAKMYCTNNDDTVNSLLMDTSTRRTPLQNGHLLLVPAFLYSLYLTLCKTDTSLRWTLSAGPKGVRLRES